MPAHAFAFTSGRARRRAEIWSLSRHFVARWQSERDERCGRDLGVPGPGPCTWSHVDWDSNLNSLGANVNVRPFAGCTLRERAHQTQLQTWCFGGNPANPFATVQNGTSGADADILHLCPTGGQQSFFVGRNL